MAGKQQLANTLYASKHPLIVYGKHELTHLLIKADYYMLDLPYLLQH